MANILANMDDPALINAPIHHYDDDPVAVFLRATLGIYLRIREPIPSHRIRFIVHPGRALELCELGN